MQSNLPNHSKWIQVACMWQKHQHSPRIITDSAPLVLIADLYSAIPLSEASHQTKGTISTIGRHRYYHEWRRVVITYIKLFNTMQLHTRTFYSRMVSTVTERGYTTNAIMRAVQYVALSSSTTNIIKPHWSTCTAVERVQAWDWT